jgi:hypothetical protein
MCLQYSMYNIIFHIMYNIIIDCSFVFIKSMNNKPIKERLERLKNTVNKYMSDVRPDRPTTCQSERKSVVSRRRSVFAFGAISLNHIYTHQPKIVNIICSQS